MALTEREVDTVLEVLEGFAVNTAFVRDNKDIYELFMSELHKRLSTEPKAKGASGADELCSNCQHKRHEHFDGYAECRGEYGCDQGCRGFERDGQSLTVEEIRRGY